MVRVSLPGALCFAATLAMMMRGSAIAEATAADQRVEPGRSEDEPEAVFIKRPGSYSKYLQPYLLVPRSPRGPQPKNKDLILEVEFDQQNCLLGEPLLLRCSLMNYSAKPIELSYGGREQSENTILFEITAPNGKQVPQYLGTRDIGLPQPVEVLPGHRLVELYNLFDVYAIHAVGDYKISVRYRSDGTSSNWRTLVRREGLWKGNLECSVGIVRIVSPTKDVDKAALNVLGADSEFWLRRSRSPFRFQHAFLQRRRPPEFIEEHGDSRYAAYARYFAAVEGLAWREMTKSTRPKYVKRAITHLKAIDTAGFPRLFQELCLFNLLYAHAVLEAEPPAGVSKQRFLQQFPDSPLVFVLKQPQFKDLD